MTDLHKGKTMAKMTFAGPWRYRISGYAALMRLSFTTALRHAAGRRLVPSWGYVHEIGVRFWRHQFTRAMNMDIAEGRKLFDAVQTRTGLEPGVIRTAAGPGDPPGTWVRPARVTSPAVLLYFHGGGYAFDGSMTDDFAALLADATGAPLFKLAYRLTPEHPHPCQQEDALAAVRWLLDTVPPDRLVLVGDSAGGHLALMTLIAMRAAGLPQPALAVGLSPWTDIAPSGASYTANDRFDIVAGWMATRFGEWLTGDRVAEMREELSPVCHDFTGLAPLYLQAGGKEVLVDMIRGFARGQSAAGARITLDVWPDMTHDFFGYGASRPESVAALRRIGAAVQAALDGRGLDPIAETEAHGSPVV